MLLSGLLMPLNTTLSVHLCNHTLLPRLAALECAALNDVGARVWLVPQPRPPRPPWARGLLQLCGGDERLVRFGTVWGVCVVQGQVEAAYMSCGEGMICMKSRRRPAPAYDGQEAVSASGHVRGTRRSISSAV